MEAHESRLQKLQLAIAEGDARVKRLEQQCADLAEELARRMHITPPPAPPDRLAASHTTMCITPRGGTRPFVAAAGTSVTHEVLLRDARTRAPMDPPTATLEGSPTTSLPRIPLA